MEQYLQYNKENGMYVGNAALPIIDDAFGNTEVLLPGEEFVDGIVYVFDEAIQMWRTMTSKQFGAHLEEVTPPVATTDEAFRAQVLMQITMMGKEVGQAKIANLQLTLQVADLTKRVKELEDN